MCRKNTDEALYTLKITANICGNVFGGKNNLGNLIERDRFL
jgi:hypothetical protein